LIVDSLVKSTHEAQAPMLLAMLEGVNYLDVEEERRVTRGYFVSAGRHIEDTVEYALGSSKRPRSRRSRFSL
jgi:hypothetical protein